MPKERSMRSLDRRSLTRPVLVAALALGMASPTLAQSAAAPVFRPSVAEWRYLQSSPTPPTGAACYAAGVRCFAPAAMQQAYNVSPLYERGLTGKGKTIAVIDSFGSATIANDLNVFSTAFGLPHLCGEAGGTCRMVKVGMPGVQVTPASPQRWGRPNAVLKTFKSFAMVALPNESITAIVFPLPVNPWA